MATAKDFVGRINQIDGVAGCLLVKDDGLVLGQTLDDPEEVYSTLMQISSGLSENIMSSIGFSYCQYLSFNRVNLQNFYVFPIDKYWLGIVQQENCSVAFMLERVSQLIGRVSTGGPGPVS
ncbi:MAG: roadblock/LC7 domain-containing protein [Desulfuromusa sp.]|jgi:predicted regulator of Ras-like GTPase activity (Roadblock/LC7/MglB family)|nr:roadblock/LC7 domain-containing protein [Desulfuromusa sp.]